MRQLGLFAILGGFLTVFLMLKLVSLYVNGAAVLTGSQALFAQEQANKPDEKTKENEKKDVKDKASAEDEGDKKPAKADGQVSDPKTEQKPVVGPSVHGGQDGEATKSERSLLESLRARRQKLEKREQELELRFTMLSAAQKKLEAKVGELRNLEQSVQATLAKIDKKRDENFQSLVKLYDKMKPKKAAVIFNGLERADLIALVKNMKSAVVAKILASMNPEKAQSLTHFLINDNKAPNDDNISVSPKNQPDTLPQIESAGPAVNRAPALDGAK